MKKMMYIQNHKIAGMIISIGAIMIKCFGIPIRHSSYTHSKVKDQNAALQRNRSTSSRGKVKAKNDPIQLSQESASFQSVFENESIWNFNRFKSFIPDLSRSHFMHTGRNARRQLRFPICAVGLGFDENMWLYVRQQLLDEMDTHRDVYKSICENIQEGMYNFIYNSINWQQVQAAPFRHWMQMPYTGILIAQRFGVIVHLINIKISQTYFLLWISAESEVVNPHQVASFVFVHNNACTACIGPYVAYRVEYGL
ncbi:hypothetical protein R6Q59_013634 [Mikania micrantha]